MSEHRLRRGILAPGARFRLRLAIAVGIVSLAISACGRVPNQGPVASVASPSPSPVNSPSPTQSVSTCTATDRPSPRKAAAFVYMTGQKEALLFGGSDSSGAVLGDTWIWQSGCWTKQAPSQSPSARDFAASTYDPALGIVLVYGGRGGGQFFSDTLAWNGVSWKPLASSGPQLFGGPVAGLDPVSQQPLLYGIAAGGSSQTWRWDGSAWQQLSPTTSPVGRESPSLAVDAQRGQLMLFGGFAPNQGLLNDTWFWNGSNWAQASPATSPPARLRACMGSLAARKVVILWGGVGAGVGLGDAWVWDGNNWTKIASVGIRADASAIDTGSQAIFFGGDGPTGNSNDLNAFDGTTWSTLT